ncbi:cac [Symbiodinium natans]|uniref:Cac protein n=1 Tax=Symbiodinium natans TaxID=878477 RepID=A0A812GK73_9DINO|nr:cac [Symbiodinium natans]
MGSFHVLVADLVATHDSVVSELQKQVDDLRAEVAAFQRCGHDAATESPDELHIPLAGRILEPEALHCAPIGLEEVSLSEAPFVKIFGEEVKHLGLRVMWSAERPTIQRVDEGTAAQVVGICPGDLLLAINETETAGRPREELLPLLRLRPLRLQLMRKGTDCSAATGTMTFGTPNHSVRSVNGKQKPQTLQKAEYAKFVGIQNIDDGRGREVNLTNTWADSPISVPSQGRLARESPKKGSPLVGRRDARKASKGSRAASTNSEGDEPEETQSQIGLRRFIATRKESTASVAEVGIGNFKISIHDRDQATERKSCARRLHSLLKWWSHLEEPERGGCAYRILESRPFFTLSSTVIMMHAVVVTMSSDWEVNHIGGTPPPLFNYLEMGFLAFYAIELGLRLAVHRCFFFFGESAGWNCFDFLLVAFSGFDVGYYIMQMARDKEETNSGNVSFMRLFRLFKITKILRTIRIIKVFRELSMMVESFTKCLVAMFWGLTLLIFLLYIFAQPVQNLQTQERLSLYMAVTGGNDWVEYYLTVRQCGTFYDILFLLYTFFFVFALFNIMTGVFVERALTAALPDRDEMIWEEQKKLAKQVEEFKALCNQLDTDGSGTITKSEFKKHMRSDVMVSYMSSVGLEMHDVEHFFRTVAGEDEEVSIDRFVEGCMAMRGNATALDVQRQLFECKRLSDAIRALKRETSENMGKVQWILSKAFPRLAEDMPKMEDKAGILQRCS